MLGIELDFGDFVLDGTQIKSNTVYSQTVNPDGDFVIGTSACAKFTFDLEVSDNVIPPVQGKEFTLYIDFEPRGIFVAEKPVKKDLNTVSVTAYDRMIYFDRLADEFLDTANYPVSLLSFLEALCYNCDVQLENTSIFNGDFIITEKPNAKNSTGRQLLQWICQLSACFAVMNDDGKLNLKWYEETDIVLDSSLIFTHERADYATDKLEGLQISSVYITAAVPPEFSSQNVYIIQGNPLIMISDEVELYNLGVKIFDEIKDFSYIPFKLSTPYFSEIQSQILIDGESRILTDINDKILLVGNNAEKIKAGDIITVQPRKGEPFTAHVMSFTAEGTSFFKAEMSASGNKTRDTKTDIYAQIVTAISQNTAYITKITREQGIEVTLVDVDDPEIVYGKSVINPTEWYTELGGEKVLYIDYDVNPPKMVFNGETSFNAADYYTKTDVDGKITTLNTDISSVTQTASELQSTVSSQTQALNSITDELGEITENVSSVTQTAEKIEWIVSGGTDLSSMTLTDKFYELVADEIILDGFVKFTNTSGTNYYPAGSGANITSIDAGHITTGMLTAPMVNINNETYH